MQSKTDKELLDRFVATGDGAAFAELVSRYTPMVYRACRRLLGNDHDAEDATQAAFVVLARKAGSLRQEGRLNGWLHRVARLVALEALRKRMQHERNQMECTLWQESLAPDLSEAEHDAVRSHVDAELDGLSAILREAIVLRYLRGFSEQAAAVAAGCPLGTMKRRASDGIAKLRQRLAKRGVALGGAALAGLLTSEASAAIPETLLPSILATVKTAVATTATATGASSTAAMLAKGAMKAMFIAKVKMVAAVVAVAAGLSLPIGLTVAGMTNKSEKVTEMTNAVSQDVVAGDYLVIDISGGPSASNYPVGYLSALPSGGWTDEHKTTKLVMRKIPAGTFTMGSPSNELGRNDHETQHTVTLTKAFYIGVFEVTQRQWELVMGNRPSFFTSSRYYLTRPVEQVSYYDVRENADSNSTISTSWPASGAVGATSFLGKLRAKTGLATFDLPTEAQWEYACRAGTTQALNSGHNLTDKERDARMDTVGRYQKRSTDANCATNTGTATVGSYLANAWGLYDMHGNVSEWCLDWFGMYSGSAQDPAGELHSEAGRVLRGGVWGNRAEYCRSASRDRVWPDCRNFYFGFRAAMTLQ
jgi:RNA polymerase sigma factor (sigma-70 family)